jgi:hypothetical protein
MGIYYQLFILSYSCGCLQLNWFSRNSSGWCGIPWSAFASRHDHLDMLASSSGDAIWWILTLWMPHYREVEAAYMAIKPLRRGRFSIVPWLHETLKASISRLTWIVLHPFALVCLLPEALAIFLPSSTRDHILGFFLYFSYLNLIHRSNIYAPYL